MVSQMLLYLSSAITIQFEQSTYIVDEDDGPVQPVLVLSNPSSTSIIVQVRDIESAATGEYSTHWCQYYLDF